VGITYVGSGADGQNGTAVAPTYPAGIQAGDVAYLAWTYQSTATGVTNPSGYLQQGTANMASGSGTVRVLTRVLDGSETAGQAITCAASTNKMTAALEVLRGVDTANVINGSVQFRAETVAGTTHACPSATPTVSGCVALTGIAERSSTGTSSYTAPSGYTKRAEGVTTAAGMTITAIADDGLATPHASGTAVTPPVWTSGNTFSTANVETFTWLVPPAKVTGSAALSASGTLTAAGTVRASASAAMSSTGTLTATATVRQRGGAALTATGALTAAGRLRIPAAAPLTATGALAATARVRVTASAALAATGALGAVGLRRVPGTAALSATGTLGARVAGQVTGSAALTAQSSLTAAGRLRVLAAAPLTAASTLTAAGQAHVLAAIDLAAVGTLTATADGGLTTRGIAANRTGSAPTAVAHPGAAPTATGRSASTAGMHGRVRRLSHMEA